MSQTETKLSPNDVDAKGIPHEAISVFDKLDLNINDALRKCDELEVMIIAEQSRMNLCLADAPLCRDCEFCKRDWLFGFDECENPASYGVRAFAGITCRVERLKFNNLDNCGTQARYFQPRKTFFQKLKALFGGSNG